MSIFGQSTNGEALAPSTKLPMRTNVTTPAVDVVILAWNDGELLAASIESVLESEGVDPKIFVVDNGSEPPASVPDDDRIRVLRNDVNQGVAPGRAQGIAAGSAEFVCLLDSDARVHPHTLATLLGAMDDDVAMAVPVFDDQRPDESAGQAPSAATKVKRGLGLSDGYSDSGPFDVQGHREVDFGIGACQMIRRSAHDAAGGLDTNIFYGPEDVDFCLRLRRAGWRILQVSDATCFHPARRRNRKLLTSAGKDHAVILAKHLWRNRDFTPGDPSPDWLRYDLHGRCVIDVSPDVPGAGVIDEMLGWASCTIDEQAPAIQVFASVDVAARHAEIDRTNGRRGPGFDYGDGWFTTEDGRILVAQHDGTLVVGADRSIDRLLLTMVDWLVTKQDTGLIHAAAIAVGDVGVLLSGWGGVGKTATLTNLCRQSGARFIGDDMMFVTGTGEALSLPKPMIIYSYHQPLFPELFASPHKTLVPSALTSAASTARDLVRPLFDASPGLEDWARRVTPQHMKTQPSKAIPGLEIVDRAKVDLVVRLERSTVEHKAIVQAPLKEATDGLVTEFVGEQTAGTGLALLLAATSAGIRTLDEWLADRRGVMRRFCDGPNLVRIQLPASMSAEEASGIVSDIVRDRVG